MKTLTTVFKYSLLLKTKIKTMFQVLTVFFEMVINFSTSNFMAPFYGWGSTASRLQPLRGGSLLFTIQFPEIPGTHFIDLGRMKS